MDAYLAVVSKRDVPEYSDEPIPEEVVRRILDAGRLAGSAGNRQPWRFVVPESQELVAALAESVYVPQNVLGATLVVAVATPGGGAAFDAGRAAQNMMLAAWSQGVVSRPNGMPDPARTASLLGLEDDLRPVVLLSFGYPASRMDPERLRPEDWSRRARRKPLEEVVRRV